MTADITPRVTNSTALIPVFQAQISHEFLGNFERTLTMIASLFNLAERQNFLSILLLDGLAVNRIECNPIFEFDFLC